MAGIEGPPVCVAPAEGEAGIARGTASRLLAMGLVVVLGTQGTQVAQHEAEVWPLAEADDVVDPGLAFAADITAADDAAVSVPGQG